MFALGKFCAVSQESFGNRVVENYQIPFFSQRLYVVETVNDFARPDGEAKQGFDFIDIICHRRTPRKVFRIPRKVFRI